MGPVMVYKCTIAMKDYPKTRAQARTGQLGPDIFMMKIWLPWPRRVMGGLEGPHFGLRFL